jgi:hypothetical protein
MSHFIDYLSELNTINKSSLISVIKTEYIKLFESNDTISELDEYFDTVKSKVDKQKTLAAQQGNGRLQSRPVPGRGSLSYNPENPTQPAQNAN